MSRPFCIAVVLLFCALAPAAPAEEAAKPAPPAAQAQGPQQAQPGQPKFYREGLSGVDFTGMDAAAKERALKIMNDNRCVCGCNMTIAQCRVEDPGCPRSPGLAAAIMSAVKTGKSDTEVLAALKAVTPPAAPPAPKAAPAAPGGQPTPAQAVPKVELDTAGAPSRGPANAKVTVVTFEEFQ